MGNFSYCVAVRELMAVPVQLRILALTATPGSKQQNIQHVIDNLRISTLEYRNESDDDVSPFVHNRKIELMQVPMGQNAVEVNNLLLDVTHSIATRLCSMGVLQNRDFQTLSPCELLNSRDKFVQAPPPELSNVKCGEVQGYFGVLITLYHIRKLLSSHGIRPAYEMLEEKLRPGLFSRLMSRNEVIQRTKIIMQQSLSHGAPSPKLSKMLEVLVDHFKTNDPQSSRVIIFTNFRGSVRDIMDSLANIKDSVKATQFVGQSSGKTLKGQTQKVQQAVLEEFRRGGYNVIVATSIGEEGLDIMEVDLVICFDANVSHLRMIQRMGRTGRKHDGRVVVLACEGAELKGYMRKQATSKAVRKHMQNGGMNSFSFHSSPRMVPHVYKPELQYLEISIEQFVPRGKKVKDDSSDDPLVIDKLTDAEAVSLAKYFQAKENTWKPSLIAFPSFQELPSKVHRVMHSSRTGMLIDAVQFLTGLSCTDKCGTCEIEPSPTSQGQASRSQPVAAGSVELSGGTKGSVDSLDPVEAKQKPLDTDIWPTNTMHEDKYVMPDSPSKVLEIGNPCPDAPICREKFGRPNSPGKVSDAVTAPAPPCISPRKRSDSPAPLHSFLFGSKIASVDSHGRVSVACAPLLLLSQTSYSKSRCPRNTALLSCSNEVPGDSNILGKNALDHDGFKNTSVEPESEFSSDPKTPNAMKTDYAEDCIQQTTDDNNENIFQPPPEAGDPFQISYCGGTPNAMAHKSSMIAAGPNDNVVDLDLSPRLTNFIESGCVPESPLNNPCTGSATMGFLVNGEAQTPIVKAPETTVCFSSSPAAAQDVQTPLANSSNSSCSRDWHMSSGRKSETTGVSRQFKRLRKIGDSIKDRTNENGKESSVGLRLQLVTKFTDAVPSSIKLGKGRRERFKDARDLIDEEAEVSSEVEVSEDEEDDANDDSFEDSFIDDRLNPTAASSDPKDGGVDMMAIYRRSLLSQSPDIRPHHISGFASSEFGGAGRIPSDRMPSTSGRTHETTEHEFEISRKRKLSNGFVPLPATNLEREFMSCSTATIDVSRPPGHANANGSDVFSDDQFYEGLDLDQLEAEAAKLLKQKTDSFDQDGTFSQPTLENISLFSSPSFDLGIS
ncbi:hypothetical protein Dimus_006750 [Dionaea muscipula]